MIDASMIRGVHLLRPNLETITYRQLTAVDTWSAVTVNYVKGDPRVKAMAGAGGGATVQAQTTSFHALTEEMPAGFEGKYRDQIIDADGFWWSVDVATKKTTTFIWKFDCVKIAAMS